MMQNGGFESLPKQIVDRFKDKGILEPQVWSAIRGALNPKILVSNLAEVFRMSDAQTQEVLSSLGLSDLMAHVGLDNSHSGGNQAAGVDYFISETRTTPDPFPELMSVVFSPPLDAPVKVDPKLTSSVDSILKQVCSSSDGDVFASLYRKDVLAYYREFISNDSKLIDGYIAANFKSFPKYIVNSGIGGNEQFAHFVSYLNNSNPDRKTTWFVVDASRQLAELPEDATKENTLFMEYSRSGKTEETVKIHELTSRTLKRIVYANSGPLFELGKRDSNLVLSIPEQVSGRFGRNKTPTLLATMYVCGMDVESFWQDIGAAINAFDLTSGTSLPVLFAKFIYLFQQLNGINHIYLGYLGQTLKDVADEFVQFWDEGVNKNGNDLMMSRYIGLPRDSHSVVEGILGNNKTKMSIFLLQKDPSFGKLPDFVLNEVDPISPLHLGVSLGEDEYILSEANFQRFSQVMPCIKITLVGKPNLHHAAILGQLWADITYVYSKMMNIDPGSNPEVKFVRDRSAELLAEYTKTKK
jgi:hypothetical protein